MPNNNNPLNNHTVQRYFLKLSYNGTNYHGWQIQENTTKTIQQTINGVLSLLLNEEITVTGCGRTDTGVHAKAFYAHFDSIKTDLTDTKHKWLVKFNQVLPHDIAIQEIIPVKSEANSRFDATSRTYQYFIHTSKDPFKTNMSHFLFGRYNIQLMNAAAQELYNYTDFSAFSKSNTQTATNNCKIYQAGWEQQHDQLIFTIKADRFLRNMVRAVVGTLLEVGKEKISITDFKNIIESKNRSNAGMSVEACGLYLTEVEYPLHYFNTNV